MSADSSSAGSVARKAANISRNTSGAWCIPSMMIMPGSENASTTRKSRPIALRKLLIRPMSLLSRNTQEIVKRMPGTISGMSDAA